MRDEEVVGADSSNESTTRVSGASSYRGEAAATNCGVAASIAGTCTTWYSHSPFIVDKPLTPPAKAKFDRLCLETIAESNLPFDFFEKDSTRALFEFTRKGVVEALPKAKRLSGTLLTAAGLERQQQMLPLIQEKVKKEGTALTVKIDSWKDVSSNDVVGTMVGTDDDFFCYDQVLGPEAQSINRDEEFDGLAAARMIEEKIVPAVKMLVATPVAAFISDESGELSRAKRILALRFPAVYWGKCYAHQNNRLVRDVLTHTCFQLVAAVAIALVSCFNNSKAWRNTLVNKCRQLYKRSGPLLAATENRWCSAQACFASILRLQKSIQLILLEHSNELPPALARVLELGQEFWTKLREVHEVVFALCKSQLVLQRRSGSLADVVFCYGRFSEDMGHQDDLATQVQKRWEGTEQPLFLLAASFDRHHVEEFRGRCDASGVVTGTRLSQVAVYYYHRFIGDDSAGVADAFLDWWEGKVPEERLYQGQRVWRVLGESERVELKKLARLARHVCSLPVHTADCERLFSDYGNVKTPARNRMSTTKMHLLTQVKHDMRDRKRKRQQEDDAKKRRRLVSATPYEEKSSSSSVSEPQQQPSSSSGSGSPPLPNGYSRNNAEDEGLWVPEEVDVEIIHEVDAQQSTDEDGVADGWAVRFRAVDEQDDAEPDVGWECTSDTAFIEAATGYAHTKGDEYRLANVLPRVNVPRYPQDKLTGVRAWKVPLKALFPPAAQGSPDETQMQAVMPFLSSSLRF
eukprot:GHVU01130653.1.p1 GENE.GHVU01130653.1~~GHVU01130653.1.p1  ORF type:complete len:869 (+),score=113.14 GHVU01130653.1:371-2608(+)